MSGSSGTASRSSGSLRNRVSTSRKPACSASRDERLGDERLCVREVGEVAAQRQRRERVDRLGDQQTSGPELHCRELEQPEERRRREMLDDLRREDTAERAVLKGLEVGNGIRLLDVEPLTGGVRDHVRVGVDPPGLDTGLAQQREELAAPAADVEHGTGVAEVLDVRTLTVADGGGGAAHPRLECEVVGQGSRSRLRGDGHRRR